MAKKRDIIVIDDIILEITSHNFPKWVLEEDNGDIVKGVEQRLVDFLGEYMEIEPNVNPIEIETSQGRFEGPNKDTLVNYEDLVITFTKIEKVGK